MPRYITCLSRFYISIGQVPGMKKCTGVPSMRSTHCEFCEYYEGEEPEEDIPEDVVIMEEEEAEWK